MTQMMAQTDMRLDQQEQYMDLLLRTAEANIQTRAVAEIQEERVVRKRGLL